MDKINKYILEFIGSRTFWFFWGIAFGLVIAKYFPVVLK